MKNVLLSTLLISAAMSTPTFAAEGTGVASGTGAAGMKGVAIGKGTVSGTGTVIYRNQNGNLSKKSGTGTVSGKGIAIGKGKLKRHGRHCRCRQAKGQV